MDFAFEYAEGHPLETESEYPYQAKDGTCEYKAKEGVVKALSFKDVPANNPQQLKLALSKGPLSVGIQADSAIFQ